MIITLLTLTLLTLLVLAITRHYRRVLQLHEQIGGRWRPFLSNWVALKWYARSQGGHKGRLDLHNVWRLDQEDGGMLPFPEETAYARPKLDASEDLYIYGSNTEERTTLEVVFRRRPLPLLTGGSSRFDQPKDQVEVSLKLVDGQTGNVYSMAESSVVDFSPTEYRASGFAFESLQANKTGRIKFRGYLKRNDEAKPVYVQLRFLTLFFMKTFDHQRNLNRCLLAKELLDSGISGQQKIKSIVEDRIEQNCQIKGTFKVEGEEEEVQFFYLGFVGRRFPETPLASSGGRKVVRVHGFTRKGVGFQFGLVANGSGSAAHRYRYGYMSKQFDNWKLLQEISLSKDEMENLKSAKKLSFEVKLADDDDDQSYRFEITNGKVSGQRQVKINGKEEDEGICFITEEKFTAVQPLAKSRQTSVQQELNTALVVSLDDERARVTELTGGKGASLAQLKALLNSKNDLSTDQDQWEVPNAVVVTSSAYHLQTAALADFDERLEKLERQVRAEGTATSSREHVEAACEDFSRWFAGHPLNTTVKEALQKRMTEEFGADWAEGSSLFAVRSSAAGEDSAEMSAAGQMTTFLGVSGLEKVAKAVVKCWASQFAFVPVEYKRGYGQELDSPMAVVIQRMVNCEAAGVIFTAQPTDGDERLMTVTSNFGLGESVVSAAAEPDTFTLEVGLEANSYQVARKVVGIRERALGRKALATRIRVIAEQNGPAEDDLLDELDVEDGISNEAVADGATRQSITDQDILRLGQVALEIAAHYGNARDIEWGIVEGRLFIFQSRPITALDSNFTPWELMHEQDTPHGSEGELYSRNHWGENFPGASSWQCALFFLGGTGWAQGAIKQGQMKEREFNHLRPNMGFVSNQLMFNMRSKNFFMSMFAGYPESDNAVAQVYAFFGRKLTNEDFLEAVRETTEHLKKRSSLMFKLLFPFVLLYMVFLGCRKIPAYERLMFVEKAVNFQVPASRVPLKEKMRAMFTEMGRHFPMMQVHGNSSFGSSIKSLLLMKTLKSSWGPDAGPNVEDQILSDLNLLMSHCNDVVSAEVPNSLREIARAVEDREGFAAMSDEAALALLKRGKREVKASQLFADFLEKHGHRGYREFDPYHQPWGKAPLPCVQVLKSMMRASSLESKAEVPVETIMAQLKTPLSPLKAALVRYWLLPWVRDAVGFREHTKSLLVKFQDLTREAMWYIAHEMVAAGLIPEAELYFFLRLDELQRLLSGERCPALVMKAKQRRRLYPEMNRLKFEEFIKGMRMAPKPPKAEVITLADDAVSLSGTAVTVGSVRARVCVAETIEEAVNIQPGDILLTYSTDIGWSPYFPLISGIVTEIGGTISHGAVIAREFGLPCLIAVEDVCGHFRTGDIAYLDTKTGTIVKVKE